ncbi:MAG: ornithine cyclodeaminase family protein [Anaerolineales bacterium]
MYVLDAGQTRAVLPMSALIPAMKSAFAILHKGQVQVPMRTRLEIFPHKAALLNMPAYVAVKEHESLAVKIVTLYPQNPGHGMPFVQAVVLAFDPDNGRPIAVLNGTVLTARRTGAASGAATDLLARPDSHVAAIIGAGIQARTQLEAVCTVRPIQQAYVYAPTRAHAEQFADEMQASLGIPVLVAESAAQAVAQADVICAATTASTPVFDEADVRPGTHINGVGSYMLQMRELPPKLLGRALLFVDSLTSSLAEAGEVVYAIQHGWLQQQNIAEFGALVNGEVPGRTNREQITIFKSSGIAVQDALAVRVALNLLQNGETLHRPPA